MKTLSFKKMAIATTALIGLTAATSALAGTGGWGASTSTPTALYTKGVYYTSQWMSPVITPPGTAQMTDLSWSYNFNYHPVGTNAWIENTSGQSAYLSGASGAFNNIAPGVPAGLSLRFRFQVPGTGDLVPDAYTQIHSANVTYSY